jgi:UDP-2,3-diacylglucosamine hydrolase
MKAVFISDLHIKDPNDKAALLYQSFCSHEKTEQSHQVYLLGDIFDLLIGDHYSYTKKYEFFFQSIVKFLNSGKTVIFIEGNHDFHFEKTIKKYLRKHTVNHNNFRYSKHGELLETKDKKYFVCHGYEVDYYNEYFKRWYSVYTSQWMYLLSTYVLPYFVISFLGAQAAKDSKRRGKKTFNYTQMKNKYLEGAKALIEERKLDGVIAGHTHIQESHTFHDGTLYFNNGFPLKDKKFITLDDEKIECIKIER